MDAIREEATGVAISVFVTPRSSANSVSGMRNGEIKIALTAPPVDGAANKALVEFLSRRLGVSRQAVRIISGQTSRHKVVRVEGMAPALAASKLSADNE